MQYILYFFLMGVTGLTIWFQTVAPMRFPNFLSKHLWLVYLTSLVTGILFVEASKIGADLFGSAWTLRFLSFAINTIVFGLFTYFLMGESMTLKNIISLGLGVVIILVQGFMD